MKRVLVGVLLVNFVSPAMAEEFILLNRNYVEAKPDSVPVVLKGNDECFVVGQALFHAFGKVKIEATNKVCKRNNSTISVPWRAAGMVATPTERNRLTGIYANVLSDGAKVSLYQ